MNNLVKIYSELQEELTELPDREEYFNHLYLQRLEKYFNHSNNEFDSLLNDFEHYSAQEIGHIPKIKTTLKKLNKIVADNYSGLFILIRQILD